MQAFFVLSYSFFFFFFFWGTKTVSLLPYHCEAMLLEWEENPIAVVQSAS